MRGPSQIRLNVVIALVGTAMCAMFIYHQPFALDLGIENVRAFFVAYAAVAVFLRVAFGHQVDRIGHRRVAIGALVLYAPVVAAMAKLDVLGLPVLGAGLGLAHGLLYPSLNAVAVAEAGENERGKVMASFQAAFNVGFSGALPFLGLFAASRGYPEMFVGASLCALAGLVLLVLSPEGREGNLAPQSPRARVAPGETPARSSTGAATSPPEGVEDGGGRDPFRIDPAE